MYILKIAHLLIFFFYFSMLWLTEMVLGSEERYYETGVDGRDTTEPWSEVPQGGTTHSEWVCASEEFHIILIN